MKLILLLLFLIIVNHGVQSQIPELRGAGMVSNRQKNCIDVLCERKKCDCFFVCTLKIH